VPEEKGSGENALVQVISIVDCVVVLCCFSCIQNTVVVLTQIECTRMKMTRGTNLMQQFYLLS
jgi:hypothetical protein